VKAELQQFLPENNSQRSTCPCKALKKKDLIMPYFKNNSKILDIPSPVTSCEE
jgi:hypothetical protein